MPSNDTTYYRQRVIAERELALRSERQNVSEIHQELANQYQALVDQAELRPNIRIVVSDRQMASA